MSSMFDFIATFFDRVDFNLDLFDEWINCTSEEIEETNNKILVDDNREAKIDVAFRRHQVKRILYLVYFIFCNRNENKEFSKHSSSCLCTNR